VAGDQLSAQPGGLHDAQPLRQDRPRRGLVRRMETARPQAGQPGLRVGDHRIAEAHLRPAPAVDVQCQEPAGLARCQSPSTQNTVRRPGPAGSPAGAAGVKPSQNRRLVSSDHGSSTSTSGHTSCHRLLRPITDTRTVADGTDTPRSLYRGPFRIADRVRRGSTQAVSGAATGIRSPSTVAEPGAVGGLAQGPRKRGPPVSSDRRIDDQVRRDHGEDTSNQPVPPAGPLSMPT
jgi:hypothetical protein